MKGLLSKAIADMIEYDRRKLRIIWSLSPDSINVMVGLGFLSDYKWGGEDLIKAFRKR